MLRVLGGVFLLILLLGGLLHLSGAVVVALLFYSGCVGIGIMILCKLTGGRRR